jgi:hypothetical protein
MFIDIENPQKFCFMYGGTVVSICSLSTSGNDSSQSILVLLRFAPDDYYTYERTEWWLLYSIDSEIHNFQIPDTCIIVNDKESLKMIDHNQDEIDFYLVGGEDLVVPPVRTEL